MKIITMINFGDDHYFYGNGLVGGIIKKLPETFIIS